MIAKDCSQSYIPGKRAWVKVKHQRTADCVVIGFRWSNDRKSLGSCCSAFYDHEETLHYVRHTSSFDAGTRRKLLHELMPLRVEPSPEMRGSHAGRVEPLVVGQGDRMGVDPAGAPLRGRLRQAAER